MPEIQTHIHEWGSASPTRDDALLTLELCLSLLAQALPLALRLVGEQSIESQKAFWEAYIPLSDDNDFDFGGSETIFEKLAEFSEVARFSAGKSAPLATAPAES